MSSYPSEWYESVGLRLWKWSYHQGLPSLYAQYDDGNDGNDDDDNDGNDDGNDDDDDSSYSCEGPAVHGLRGKH